MINKTALKLQYLMQINYGRNIRTNQSLQRTFEISVVNVAYSFDPICGGRNYILKWILC